MAYSDYGAFVYLNGERRTDKEDLSCGHTFDTSCPEPPAFCSECGGRVVEEDEDDEL